MFEVYLQRMLVLVLILSPFISCADRNRIFDIADSVANQYRGHALTNLALLSNKLTSNLSTDDQKYRAIFKWVCDNIAYDLHAYRKNVKYRSRFKDDPRQLSDWNKLFLHEMYQTLVTKHKTVCTGYAYLIAKLANYAGIACVVVDGYGRNAVSNVGGRGIPNHSWNAVKLSGKWYLSDPTWAAGYFDVSSNIFVKAFEPSYFLADPSIFIRNHFPLDPAWTLVTQSYTLNDFLYGAMIYNEAFAIGLRSISPLGFEVEANGREVNFQFEVAYPEKLTSIRIDVVRNGIITSTPHQVKISNDGRCSLPHRFTTSGRFIVHVVVNDQTLLSYKVSVK